jgi:hypothetical protein
MKRVIDGRKIMNALPMDADAYSDEIDILYLDNIGVIIEYAGISPDGTITVEVKNGDSSWSGLTLSAPITIGPPLGSASPIVINLTDIPFSKLRVKFALNVGSTGTINAWLSGKSK